MDDNVANKFMNKGGKKKKKQTIQQKKDDAEEEDVIEVDLGALELNEKD